MNITLTSDTEQGLPLYREVRNLRGLIIRYRERMSLEPGSLIRYRWSCHGDCEQPFEALLYSRGERARGNYRDELVGEAIVTDSPLAPGKPIRRKIYQRKAAIWEGDHYKGGRSAPVHQVVMTTRCRKCEPCRKYRARLWAARAKAETAVWRRTWFGTLTVRPEIRFRSKLQAEKLARDRGHVFDDLSPDKQFALLHRVLGPELTKYMKRIRKGKNIRFLLVAEAHKDGYPHYHLLVHEVGVEPIRHKVLKEQWRLGFSKWTLAGEDPNECTYLCKYLAKSARARVRASRAYGTIYECTPPLGHSESVLTSDHQISF